MQAISRLSLEEANRVLKFAEKVKPERFQHIGHLI